MDEAGQPSLTTGSLIFTELRTITDVIGRPPKSQKQCSPCLERPILDWEETPTLVVELIDSFQIEQCLEGCHNGNGHCSKKHCVLNILE